MVKSNTTATMAARIPPTIFPVLVAPLGGTETEAEEAEAVLLGAKVILIVIVEVEVLEVVEEVGVEDSEVEEVLLVLVVVVLELVVLVDVRFKTGIVCV